MCAGGVGGRFALVVDSRWVGPVVEQQLGELEVAVLGRLVQGGYASLLAGVDFGASGHQEPRNVGLRTRECGVQCRNREGMARMRVDLATARASRRSASSTRP